MRVLGALALGGAEVVDLRTHGVSGVLDGYDLPPEGGVLWYFLREQVAVPDQDVQFVRKVVNEEALALMTCLNEFGH